jgi:hypothetical protein
MENIHILPTDKPSRLYLTKEGFYFLLPNIKGNDVKFQHIYITSDEEIENCWFVNLTNNEIGYIKNNIGTQKNAKKIILTTDQDLIKDGVQSIDDEFLEWFVKNPSCEEVEVQKWFDGVDFLEYKIIIPKEEPKQETPEEAAEKEYDDNLYGYEKYRYDFIEGAKWQQEQDNKELGMWKLAVEKQEARCKALNGVISDLQERMYSEEDMREAFKSGRMVKNYKAEWEETYSDEMTSCKYVDFNKWFEQSKKK